MSPQVHEPQAGRNVAAIAELVEIIVLSLDYFDILRAKDVSSFWRNVITNSPKLLRRMHKMPVLIEDADNEDPHFESPSLAAENALIQHDVDAGKPVVREAKNAVKVHLEGMYKNMTKEAINTHKYRLSLLWFRYRYGCRDTRFGGQGWPEGFREIYCHICNGFHTRLRFQNIHPLLRPLEDMQICFRGHGQHVLFTLNLLYYARSPRSCYEHVCEDFMALAKLLRNTITAMEIQKLGQDLFLQPLCTRFVTKMQPRIAENTDGVTLREVVPLMVKTLRTSLTRQQRSLHQRLQEPFTTDWDEERFEIPRESRRVAFPNGAEQWVEFVADFPSIVKMFDEAAAEVDLLFKNVAAWDEED